MSLFFQLPSKLFLPAFLFSSITACSSNGLQQQDIPAKEAAVIVTVNADKTYQTIDNFGASDAWSCQFVGKWPDFKKNAIADLLFSRDTLTSGQPKGIGLSLWRFNIGAGTTEQGEASGIKDEWRRAESFMNTDLTYDWNKQAGQIWFLKAAKERGVAEFLAFPNSPPVQLTNNKKGFASNGKPNLNAENFNAFADFLAEVVDGIRMKTGILFNHISPVNEPQWDWSDGGQEGTPFYNNGITAIVRALNASLIKKNLPTKIDVAEAGQIDYLYSDFNKQGRGSQINAFFNQNSADYIGGLSNVSQVISGHSYFTTSPYKSAVSKRQEISKALQNAPGVKYWMSEYCILGDNDGEIMGDGKDLGMDPALYIAKVIHNDMVNANASGWHWWTAISAYDYKDGLIYVDKNKTDGNYRASKMLWALGNYSHFIRPGAKRVDVTVSSVAEGLLVSSYKNTDNKLVTVIVNTQSKPVELALDLQNNKLINRKLYKTSSSADLQPQAVGQLSETVIVEEKSVLTIIGELK